jgi:catechol 2,3-dioxygenase-like lactoylglutathione lyase family enzyme
MSNLQSKTLNITSVMPSLTVDDLDRSLDFFAALGFEVVDRWEPDGKLQGATLKAGALQLGVSQDDFKKGRDRVKGVGLRFYLESPDDIDGLAARAKTAGVTLEKDPYDSAWGTRAFDVKEPSGFLITISSPEKQ